MIKSFTVINSKSTIVMKLLPMLMVLPVILGYLACSPAEKQIEEPLPAAAFKVMVVQAPVADFDKWKTFYNADDSTRVANGLETFVIGRGIDNPNMVLVSLRMSDVAKAKAFAVSPELKTRMDSAGVNGPPMINFVNVVRFDTTKSDTRTRLIIRHRVKDYDAWLKVYDDEGRSVRASHGIVDRGLGRSIDDPNMVSIVFDITDVEKAKARAASEELKKLMEQAGVEGAPEAFWYTVIEQH
jgi:hypothetical protein